MTVILRDYQQELVEKRERAHAEGAKNVLMQSPCRSGKTVTFTSLSVNDPNPSCCIVHRQELIAQISETHARLRVPHNIIAPQPVINFCIDKQIREVGRSYYDPTAPAVVAGVDTLIRRHEIGDRWCNSVKRFTIDEAHHVLQGNKWGKACALFPNALGLGVTATPIRGDGKSLHSEQGGVFDVLIQGIDMRTLIERGAIRDYRIIAPKSSIDETELKLGSTGDFTDKSVRKAAHQSEIVGDTVSTYMQHTPGRQAIAFCVDVSQAKELAEKFQAAGVKAVALDGNTPDALRQRTMDQFQTGQIQVLTNCDLFSEGLDLPGVDVCIMCRPTMSFGMFVQQFCRPLTPEGPNDTKHGIIIDQVGNVLRMAEKYGMPDTPRRWELWRDKLTNKKEPDAVPYRSCQMCLMAYERLELCCPFCGHCPEPEDRGSPRQVDGILEEMSPQLLHQLRMAKAEIWNPNGPAIPYGANDAIVAGKMNQFRQRQQAHNMLVEAMQAWGGVRLAAGDTDRMMQARFLHRFGVDVMTAQTLKKADAIKLTEEIRKSIS